MAGVGTAFALFPTANLNAYANRAPIQSRVHNNFVKAGLRLDTAMRHAVDEQKAPRGK